MFFENENEKQNEIPLMCELQLRRVILVNSILWAIRAQSMAYATSALSFLCVRIYRTIFVPTNLSGGGNIYSNVFFFVQPVLADRYFHRTR